ncbi:MAG TPA: alpha/beta hydrolase [Draconibacterium sp.]|nr:alpha/beta hydrolase [Draconibacterium sp.]
MDFNYVSRGNGIPLFFQHGLGGNLGQAQDLLKDLPCVQLISMDSRGHGKTSFDKASNISFNQYADDLISLGKQLNIEKAVYGGISMGSGIALNVAIRYPELVQALVLIRPAWLDQPNPNNLHILQNLASLLRKNEGEQIVESPEYKKMAANVPGAAQSVLGELNREQSEHTAEVLDGMCGDSPFKSLEDLRKIDIPVLIIASDSDPMHPFEFAVQLHENIQNSKLVKVASRYLQPERHWEEVLSSVRGFLEYYGFIP